jgi:GNAT superfamily N-acetyltransferase
MSQERTIVIRLSKEDDIPIMVNLSHTKRLNYEKVQPQFWRHAGPGAKKSQMVWFKELLSHQEYILLTAEEGENSVGFIIGKLVSAPEVYNPGGLTLMIDDFCVREEMLWSSVGSQLIEHITRQALDKGATQILVVCGAHDHPKRQFLENQNLMIASEWFVGGLA